VVGEGTVKYGLTLPIFDEMAHPAVLAELATEAEEAGWDGVFVWDHVYYREPATAVTDPWIALAAMACATRRVTLGPMVTPLARRRPQVVARQVVALDHLSEGRMVLGVGLGLDSSGGEFVRFGEVTDVPMRAARYDEALTLLRAMLSGERVDHEGPSYRAEGTRFLPGPFRGRLPVWTAARWPNRRPLARAAQNEGVFLVDLRPEDLPLALADIRKRRPQGLAGFEVVVQGPPGSEPGPWAEAGATWWLAAFDQFTVTPSVVRSAIGQLPGA
jgi:alkanesulfonate monooxygenase SsuD/methylene tetrahydromethanopterin reductase-like flavin-dependent oxidoreductase (luciferase family)